MKTPSWMPPIPDYIHDGINDSIREYAIAAYAAGRKAALKDALGRAMEWTEAARKDGREFGVGMDIASAIRALNAD